MSQKATPRLRFVLNHRKKMTGQIQDWQRAKRDFALAVVQEVGLHETEAHYRDYVNHTRRTVAQDIQREIDHAAKLYAKHVIGRAGQRDRTLELTAKTTEETGTARFGPWKPLAKSTTDRKGHSLFFLHGRRASRSFTGPVKNLRNQVGRGGVWTDTFGPVRVEITRTRADSIKAADLYKYGRRGDVGATFSFAHIKVFAMGRITSSMIPELSLSASQRIGVQRYEMTRKKNTLGYPDYNREAGLAAMLPGDAKFKVGGWTRSGKGAYRPSLEPFLAFALTRSIPAAVFRRFTK